MIEDVETLIIGATGYMPSDNDAAFISYLWKTEGQRIKNDINQDEIPEALDGLHTRRTAAQYIQIKKNDILGDDGAQVARSIREGDVSVELAGETKSQRLDALYAALMEDRGETVCFRKLRW